MGKFSRDKGARNERLVRDHLRKAGFDTDRVPLSGASEGYKGDLRVRFDNREILFEVKSRKNEFSKLYELLDESQGLTITMAAGVVISYDPGHIVSGMGTRAWFSLRPKLDIILKKCLLYRADSDILAVKDDRKPIIYMSWLDGAEGEPGNA